MNEQICWQPTGASEQIPPADRPERDALRVLSWNKWEILMITAGEFDGWVYRGQPNNNTITWTRYPAKLWVTR